MTNNFMWHGRNRKEAIRRAKTIGGIVIESWLPGSRGAFGYYSDARGSMPARNEQQVWPRRR